MSIYREGTTLHAPNVVNFGPETAENGWRVFAHPQQNAGRAHAGLCHASSYCCYFARGSGSGCEVL